MSKQSHFLTCCAYSLAIAGCAVLSRNPLQGSSREVAVYARLPQAAQSVVSNKTLASIATLSIVPYIEISSGSYSPLSSLTGNPTVLSDPTVLRLSQASPTIDPSRPFIVRNLRPNTNYRVLGQAYDAGNVLISKDSASFIDIPITNNDAPSVVSLPVQLVDTPFGATLSVTVEAATLWFDYLKFTLYLVAGNTQLQVNQTTRQQAPFILSNLQANTTYRLVAEAYSGGSLVASNSLDVAIGNDNAPVSVRLPLDVANKGIVTYVAGNTLSGYADGNGTAAMFYMPHGLTVGGDGNIYVADQNNCIRRVTPQGEVTTFAGSTAAAFTEGNGGAARFNRPTDVRYDPLSGNLYVADYFNYAIRKITSQGVVSTLAGGAGSGFQDGTGTHARFNYCGSIAIDSQGNLFATEVNNNAVRKITPAGVVTTFAGNGSAGHVDGNGAQAKFNGPFGIACDRQDNLYIADWGGFCIRKVTPQGQVSTLAGTYGSAGYVDGTGTAALFMGPHGVAVDAYGNLFVTDYFSHTIRKITPSGVVTTLAGNGTGGYQDGTGKAATLGGSRYPAIDANGVLYITDQHMIRRVQ